MRTLYLAALLLDALPATVPTPEPRWLVLNHAAREARERKDYAKLRATLDELAPLLPGNARILYTMAAADALLGHSEKALEELKNLAAAGLVYDLRADDDLKNLRGSPPYNEIVRQMEQNRKPVTNSVSVQTLAGQDVLPEDIAYDAKRHSFLAASVTGAKILDGRGKQWAEAPWSVMALRIDQKRQILWAASAWLPHCVNCLAGDKDKTALLSYRLDSGMLLNRFIAPVAGMFGDMTISRRGEMYVSEGIHGAVFGFAHGQYERLDQPGEFPSPQTPALSSDERTLYVPDYVRGIGAVDLRTREVKWLQPAAGIVLDGIDGLYVYRDSFIAVQNGTNPARVIRVSLDLQRQQILEANSPGLGEPTHGTLVGKTFYFLANTGWDQFDDNGKKKEGGQRAGCFFHSEDLFASNAIVQSARFRTVVVRNRRRLSGWIDHNRAFLLYFHRISRLAGQVHVHFMKDKRHATRPALRISPTV